MTRSILWALSLILLVLQYRLIAGDGSIIDVLRLRRAISAEQEVVTKLEKRNQLLDAEVQALKAKPEALEERARTELGMVKEGETFCLVVEPAR